jgi:hypothetical protein
MSGLKKSAAGLLVGAKDFLSLGIQVRPGAYPASRHSDLLETHLSVCNRMFIFYTSEDEVLSKYIKEHWNALDGLSGEFCHVYQSMLQLHDKEDAYSYLSELRNIPGTQEIQIGDLPAFVLWSDSAHLVVSMRGLDESQTKLRDLFRYIFFELRQLPRGIDTNDAKRIRVGVERMKIKPRSEEGLVQMVGPLLWTAPIIIILPIMTLTLSSVGALSSAVIFFFLLLLYGLIGAIVLKAQNRLQDKTFLELVRLVYSTSLAGFKELVSKLTSKIT